MIIIFCTFIQAQDNNSAKSSEVITFSQSLLDTTANIPLSGKWKFHSGDDSLWARSDFDDSGWIKINTNLNLDSLKKNTWTGIGWFRKEIRIDSTLFYKSVAFTLKQEGASEIYLNGRLVKKFGSISSDFQKEETYDPRGMPFIVVFDTSRTQELAIRYSNHNAQVYYNRYRSWADVAGFSIVIAKSYSAITAKVKSTFWNATILTTIGSILLAFSLLHMLIYFFYSREKENLYYAMFAGSMAVFLGISLALENLNTVSDFKYILNISPIIFITLMFVSYNLFLYAIFYDKMPKQTWAILIVGFVLTIYLIFFIEGQWMITYIFGPFLLLLTVEGVRVIILSMKRKKRNAYVIGIGVLIFFLFIIYIPISNLLSVKIPIWISLFNFYLGFLSLPISMSIYLARESARTKNDLEQRIIEVQELSQKAIEQEKIEAELRIESEREKAENERKTKELEEARQLQLSMLPRELPHLPNLEIATYTKPSTEVGGDYYDFMKSEDGTLTIIIGDATGHGLKAGTMVTATKSLFNTLGGKSDIVEILKEFNSSLYKMKLHNLAMCLSILKLKDNNLEIASAGMPPALIYRNSSSKVDEILLKGMSLGSIKDFPYYKKSFKLNAGDVILLMSDGFPERFTADRKMIDYDKGNEILAKIGNKSPNEIIDHFVKFGDQWAKGHPQEDDVTFVVVKIK